MDSGCVQHYSDDEDEDDADDDDDDDDDEDDDAKPARALVSCAVLDESVAKIPVMFVGLSCHANRHPRYSNERGHGNIKVILCHGGNGLMSQQRTQFVGHTQPVHALSLLPGRVLVSVDFCLHLGYIIVWNIARNAQLKVAFFNNHALFMSHKINTGGGEILKRLRINNLSYRSSLNRKARRDDVDTFFSKKWRKFLDKTVPYHAIKSVEGIATVRLPVHKKSYWMTTLVKQAADVLVLYCNKGRLLCYITLNLGSNSPMRILGYRKVPLRVYEDECQPSCYRMVALSSSILLPMSQYVNYSAAVDAVDTASDLLHQAFNMTSGSKVLQKLNDNLCCKSQPSDEFTDVSWNSPDFSMCSEDNESSSDNHDDSCDDAVSLKFKSEHDGGSRVDTGHTDDIARLEHKLQFQVCFPDYDDFCSQPSASAARHTHAAGGDPVNGSHSSLGHDAKATAPRVFSVDERVCVAGYGDGSLRLQPMQPNFVHKSSLLAARCNSTVNHPSQLPL